MSSVTDLRPPGGHNSSVPAVDFLSDQEKSTQSKHQEVPVHAGTMIGLKRDRTTTFATISIDETAPACPTSPYLTHLPPILTDLPPSKQARGENAMSHSHEKNEEKDQEVSIGVVSSASSKAPVHTSYLYSLAGELLFGALPLCVLSVDCNILDCNGAFLRLFGYTRAQALRLSLFQLSHANEIKDVFSMMERLLEVAARLSATQANHNKKDTRAASLPDGQVTSSPNALHTYERSCVTADGTALKLHWTVWLTRPIQGSSSNSPTFMCAMTPSASEAANAIPPNAIVTAAAAAGVGSPIRLMSPPPGTPSSSSSNSAFARPTQTRKLSTQLALPPAAAPMTTATTPIPSTPTPPPSTTQQQPMPTPAPLSALSVLSEVALPSIPEKSEAELQQQAAVHAQVQHAQAQHHAAAAAQHAAVAASFGHMQFHPSGAAFYPPPPPGYMPMPPHMWSPNGPTGMAPPRMHHPLMSNGLYSMYPPPGGPPPPGVSFPPPMLPPNNKQTSGSSTQ